MTRSLAELAARIAQASSSGPAPPSDVDRLRSILPRWSPDLETLLSTCNGSSYQAVLAFGDYLLTAAEIGQDWQGRVAETMRAFGREELAEIEATPAGSYLGAWGSRLVPLSNDGGGDCWALDLRDGPAHGGVIRWRTSGGGFLPHDLTLPSLRDLLAGHTLK